MIANSRLRALLAQQPKGEITVPFAYKMFVAGGFNRVQKCLLFREFSLGQTVAATASFGDATGYEGSVNGHHLVDYLPPESPRNLVTIAHTALACARFLALRLRAATSEPCRVIFGVRDRDATLRFHKLRKHEPPWLAADLEGYLEEAVGYLDTTDADLDELTAVRA